MKPGSPQYRTVCIVSYAVLALVLLIAGLIWRGEVKGQAARKQQAAEQAEAEQYRAWYERRARELRWQVGQRAPNPKAKPKSEAEKMFESVTPEQWKEMSNNYGVHYPCPRTGGLCDHDPRDPASRQ